MSNAERYFYRVSQQRQAVKPRANKPAALNQQDQMMMVALDSDLKRLAGIQSRQSKTALKRDELIPRYHDYLLAMMVENQARTPEIIARNMIWAFDAGKAAWGFELGQFAVKHNIAMPEGFRRDVRNAFVGDAARLALSWIKERGKDALKDLGFIWQVWELADGNNAGTWDLLDDIRADLYKAVGFVCEYKEGFLPDALDLYKAAKALNPRIGVTRDIARLEKLCDAAAA